MPDTQLYIIRHGKAEGNKINSPLRPEGEIQAERLSDFLLQRNITNIKQLLSSPYLRATQTAEFIARKLNMEYSIKDTLREIDLDEINDDENLVEKIKKQFENFNLKLIGRESNQDVMNRLGTLKDDLLQSGGTFLLVTHSVTMTLLLRHFDSNRFGFEQWEKLTNPDVYLVTLTDNDINIEDIWN
ncbi:histidine phosphatase family protein [Bacillus cereus group sp. Bce005]|uniref:histidine phosphatase family protein n=1 Tax=Bacillus cereus group sp. Bce005 TaxID=3445256 RepID=UPI003F24ED2C